MLGVIGLDDGIKGKRRAARIYFEAVWRPQDRHVGDA